MAIATKANRIDFRVSELDKAKLEKAAQLRHLSLTSYISSVALKQADMDILENDMILLNDSDAGLVMKLLSSDIEPNENLTRLFK